MEVVGWLTRRLCKADDETNSQGKGGRCARNIQPTYLPSFFTTALPVNPAPPPQKKTSDLSLIRHLCLS